MSVVKTLSRELAAVGITSGVLAVAPAEQMITEPEAWGDVSVIEFAALRHRADVHSMWTAMRAAYRVRARVVVVHSARHAAPVALGRLLSGQKVAFITREGAPMLIRGRALDVQSLISVGLSRAVVVLTPEARDTYPLAGLPLPGLARLRVIPNGVDIQAFDGGERRLPWLGDVPVIGMASRFVPVKHVTTLIEAAAILRTRWGQLSPRVLVAGDGPDKERIMQCVADQAMGGVVTFCGQVPEQDMPGFYRSLDCYVQATDGEGFSNSLIQAAASALPIVASDVPGVRDVFTDGLNARLVRPRDALALAEALDEVLYQDSGLSSRLAMGARALASTQYSSRRMAVSYSRVFAELDPSGPWVGFLRPFAEMT